MATIEIEIDLSDLGCVDTNEVVELVGERLDDSDFPDLVEALGLTTVEVLERIAPGSYDLKRYAEENGISIAGALSRDDVTQWAEFEATPGDLQTVLMVAATQLGEMVSNMDQTLASRDQQVNDLVEHIKTLQAEAEAQPSPDPEPCRVPVF